MDLAAGPSVAPRGPSIFFPGRLAVWSNGTNIHIVIRAPTRAVCRRQDAHRSRRASPSRTTGEALRVANDGFTKAADVTSITPTASKKMFGDPSEGGEIFLQRAPKKFAARRDSSRQSDVDRHQAGLDSRRRHDRSRPSREPATRFRPRRLAADARRPRLR